MTGSLPTPWTGRSSSRKRDTGFPPRQARGLELAETAARDPIPTAEGANPAGSRPDFTLNLELTGNASEVRSLAIQPDGKILVAGSFTALGGTARNNIARIHASGTLDTAFNPNAIANRWKNRHPRKLTPPSRRVVSPP